MKKQTTLQLLLLFHHVKVLGPGGGGGVIGPGEKELKTEDVRQRHYGERQYGWQKSQV